jgi:hypothetical protein
MSGGGSMIIFRVVATLAGLSFVVAVVLMASAPWVLWQSVKTSVPN